MNLQPFSSLLLTTCLTFSGLSYADTTPPVPQLQNQIEAFQAQQKPGAMSKADQAVMQQAATDLAEAMPDPGLAVGTKAPDFTLPNASGNPTSLHQALQNGPVILTFYRGAWCPYCNLQLKALRDSMPHFQKHKAQLLAITPQTPDHSLKQVQEDQYPFEILSDLEDKVTRAYNLYFDVPPALNSLYQEKFELDISQYNGAGRYGLPIPGTFVIDQKGIIRAAFADTDYKKRMEPADILTALEGL